MAAEQTDVKLIIQARDDASKQLDELVKVTREFVKQNKELTKVSGSTDTALNGLRGQYKKLSDAAGSLRSVIKLTDNLSKQADRARALIIEHRELNQTLALLKREQSEASASTAQQRIALEKARTAVSSQTTAVSRYRKQLRDLQSAEKQNATAIEQVNQKLSKSQQRLVEARAERDKLTASARKAAVEERRLGNEVDKTSVAIEKTRQKFKEANAEKRKAAAAAREAGVDTRKLSSEQNRLQQELEQTEQKSREAAQATRSYAGAMKQSGSEARRSSQDVRLFGRESRQSMSIAQRARGQLLSLAAAYIGLYGAINQVSAAYTTYFQQQSAAARMGTQFGDDQEALAREMDFVGDTANRLGQDIEEMERSYSKFFVVSREAGNETEETRGLFLALAESATAMRVSTDDFQGSMRAIEQIMSKGQVMAEELRGQLGERFPAAVSIMARSLGLSTKELNKMMEQGELTADSLFTFAQETQNSFGKGLPAAIGSFQAAWTRLTNTVTARRRDFAAAADGGLRDSIERLTDFLNSPAAIEGTRAIADGFARAVDMVTTLMQRTEELSAIFNTVFYTVILGATMRATRSMYNFGASIVTAQKDVSKLGRVMKAALILPLVAEGGKYIWEKWGEDIKEFWGRDVVYYVVYLIKKTAVEAVNMFDSIKIKMLEMSASIDEFLAKSNSFFNNTAAAAKKQEAATKSRMRALELELGIKQRNLALELEFQKAVTQGDNDNAPAPERGGAFGEASGLMEKEAREAAARRAKEVRDAAAAGRLRAEQAAREKELADLRKSITGDIQRMEMEISKSQVTSLDEYIALVDQELLPLQERVNKLGDDSVKKTFKTFRELKREQAAATYEAEKYKDAEKGVNELLQQRRDIMSLIKMLQDGNQSDQNQASALKENLAGVNTELSKAIDGMIALAEAADDQRLVTRLNLMKAELKQTQTEVALTGEMVDQQIADNGVAAFDSIASSMADFLTGAGSLKDVFSAAKDAMAQFAADTLMWLAQIIVRQLILNALGFGGGGSVGGSVAGAFAGMFHEGGVVGSGGTARAVDPGWFSGAARYHTGGVVGLNPDEVPAILQRNEEVITESDPRHRFNGGQPARGGGGTTIINTIDPAEVVSKGMSTPAGSKVLINAIRVNKSQIQQIMGN